MKTIKQVSKFSGASVRTLQYYDNINLLVPSTRTESGYRLYNDDDIAKLQQILFLKELGFSLRDIRSMINHPGTDQTKAYHEQKELLCARNKQAELAIQILDRLENGVSLDDCAEDIKSLSKESKIMKSSIKSTLFISLILVAIATGSIYIILQNGQSDPAPTTNIVADIININPLRLTGSAARDLVRKPVEITTLLNLSPSAADIDLPADLQNNATLHGLYARDIDSDSYDKLVNYIILSNDGIRSVYISFSADRQPIREMYTPEGEPSIINGHEVMISHATGEVYIGEKDASEPIENYYADFSTNGLNYNVETHGLNETEVITLLRSLL